MSRENLLLGQLAVEKDPLSPKRTRSIESRGIQTNLSVHRCTNGSSDDGTTGPTTELQNKRRVQVGEALTRLSFISEDRLVQELRRFKAEAERPHIREVTLPGYLNNHRVAEYLLDLVPALCSEQAGCSVFDLTCEKVHRVDVDVVASVLIRANEQSGALLHQAKNLQQS